MNHLTNLSLREVAATIKSREVSPVEVTLACLDKIIATQDKLNSFSNVLAETALEEARTAESEILAGNWRGELHGIPIGIKELYDIEGIPTTASSNVRENWIASSDSASVARLRDAGAVILGKTHTSEFAYGIATPKSRNPWDIECMPGGSSGGSAASVASGSTFMSMGTDTGGSIRIPAAVCGTVGLKPTFGRCSRAGVTSLSWSLDHVGPLTRTVADAAVCLNALAGFDSRDPGSIDVPTKDYTASLGKDVRGIRIGVPSNFLSPVDVEVEAAVSEAIQQLILEGAVISEIKIPYPEQIMATEFAICMAEASEYHRTMLRNNPDLSYTEEVQTLLEVGELLPATRYVQALRVRRLMQHAWAKLFDDIDILITPAVPLPATKAGQNFVNWPAGLEESITSAFIRLSAPANILGLPAIVTPCGFTKSGLPIAFQAIARPFDEATVIRLCDAYQRMTNWGVRKPA